MKYRFPSPYASHIVDEKGETVLDVPMKNNELMKDWEMRKLTILTWLNDRKIVLPIEDTK